MGGLGEQTQALHRAGFLQRTPFSSAAAAPAAESPEVSGDEDFPPTHCPCMIFNSSLVERDGRLMVLPHVSHQIKPPR